MSNHPADATALYVPPPSKHQLAVLIVIYGLMPRLSVLRARLIAARQ
jgi:hypothetical protein